MLKLTSAAINAIGNWIAETDIDEPVLALVRASKVGESQMTWSMAIYRRENVPSTQLFALEGYDFYIDENCKDAATDLIVDFKGGRFVFAK